MAAFQLTVILGASAGRTFDVPDSGATLGRSRMADIQLPDSGLSRLHCRFYRENGIGMVQDLGSSNGTTINGREIGTDPVRISDGDCVAVGETALRISGVAESSEARLRMEPVMPPAAPQIPEAPVIHVSVPDPAAVPVSVPDPAAAPSPDPAAGTLPEIPDLFGGRPEPAGSSSVDLGLAADAGGEEKRRSPLTGLIFALAAILVLLLGAAIIFTSGGEETPDRKPRSLAEKTAGEPFEFIYERLSITGASLFRYTLTCSASGRLSLSVDDLGTADRSFTKEKQLTDTARKMLRKEVESMNCAAVRELFPERSPDGISLKRKSLTLVLGTEIWSRTAENVDNQAFDAICERLELFGRNELGWDMNFSVSELEAMGREQLSVAQRYWEQRDLGDEKLFQAVTAYRQGVSALNTLNPKPAFAQELSAGLREAEALLDVRYEAASFAVDQAMNTQRYDRAAEELRRIVRMIPDRDDERNVKAMESLLLIENRYLRKGGR